MYEVPKNELDDLEAARDREFTRSAAISAAQNMKKLVSDTITAHITAQQELADKGNPFAEVIVSTLTSLKNFVNSIPSELALHSDLSSDMD